MGKEEIINRIIADAEREADEILRAASSRADEIVEAAKNRALTELAETENEVSARAKRIYDGKAAAARLDSAKILLAEKRRVIDEIYSRALEKLKKLSERDALKLMNRLIEENAEEGDEIVFSENFPYAAQVEKLAVVKERKLKVSSKRVPLSGGCLLRGKSSDKDLSYSALLNADMEEHQADIAAQLFAGSNKNQV